uniref:Ig-like domain-containing protein n=1 Tax=Oryzias sinensis TaxID=183150 RepID=A0A8C7XV59_9TELE
LPNVFFILFFTFAFLLVLFWLLLFEEYICNCGPYILQGTPESTLGEFLVWRVDRLTEWSIKAMCYAVSDVEGKCDKALSLTVYQPPTAVSITYVNHTGPLFESSHYSLQCTVQDVAPLEKVILTFYKGLTMLSQIKFNHTRQKTPVNESITQSIVPRKEDNGTQYWCEAKLELGPEGPQQPLVVASQKLTLLVGQHTRDDRKNDQSIVPVQCVEHLEFSKNM